MKRPGIILSLVLLAATGPLRADAPKSESMADRELKKIVAEQKAIFDEADKHPDKLDEEGLRIQLQAVVHEYDRFLADNPKNAAGYAAYGYLLGKIGMRKESLGLLMKANQLDSDIPLVKNQIGNYLAESGKPVEALGYFMAAIKLEPNEPLYHYQLGALLTEARDEFLKSGEWTREALDHSAHEAFRKAAELAPDRFEFTYRYAESFYDLETPDWDSALKAWNALEAKAPTPIERQTMQLHKANIFIKTGKLDEARTVLGEVKEPALQNQKQKLVAQLPENAKN